MRRWFKRFLVLVPGVVLFFLLVVIPVGGSFLVTNSRFRFPERGLRDPRALGLSVTDIEFASVDGVDLRGWWNPGDVERPVIVFVHGLNRTRFELLERAAESHQKGYGTLLFDLRNHGESGDAYTTLGVYESQDVCAAAAFVENASPGRPIVFWGVSLGASTALLGANRCPGAEAVIADSAFLSFEETISHHVRLIFMIPSFPVANLLTFLTRMRMGFDLEDGDVERAVHELTELPILFIAGGRDRRMPPRLAQRLYDASAHTDTDLLIIEEATHGRAFEEDRERYLDTVFNFLDQVFSLSPSFESGL